MLKKEKFDEHYIKICSDYYGSLATRALPVIFDNQHFALLQGITLFTLANYTRSNGDQNTHYEVFRIEKKSGGYREIAVPSLRLGIMQRWILKNILEKVPISEHAHGFLRGRSIVSNAIPHSKCESLVNVDIKDFFPSISYEVVHSVFKELGYTKELCQTFSELCTYRDYLPQGAPTSPMISNIVCRRLDKRLGSLAKFHNANYTRYADDITFSGDKNILFLLAGIREIIEDEGFILNHSKTRFKLGGQRKIVTGLVVNGKQPRVPKSKKRFLRQQIYYCRKYGVDNHLRWIGKDKLTGFRNYLYGLAYYIKMVEPDEGLKFLRELDEIVW